MKYTKEQYKACAKKYGISWPYSLDKSGFPALGGQLLDMLIERDELLEKMANLLDAIQRAAVEGYLDFHDIDMPDHLPAPGAPEWFVSAETNARAALNAAKENKI